MRLVFIKKKFSIHGGAERYLQTFIQHLKKAKHEIHIFANKWDGEDGIIFHKINILPFTSFLSALTFNMNTNSKLKTLNSKPDCVISFERTNCQDIYRAGEGCHAEWLQIREEIEPFFKKISFRINPLHVFLLRLERKLFSNTKKIIANSKMIKKQIIKHYAVPEERITVVYNGVDLERFKLRNRDKWREDIRKRLNVSGDTKVLLFVGSGFQRKGLKTFVEAVSLLKYKNIKALVIGKGDVRSYKTMIRQYDVSDNFIFIKPQKEIEKFYAAADIFVLPTLYDPFSNATMEAMAAGLPVITTRNNGVAELIEEGHEGFVMENLIDARELSEKIDVSLGNIEYMGKMARKKAEEFPIEKAIAEFIRIIQNA
ncbi:MAG: glycosyltransferase family 4 protein [Thermodesulfovibrionales bacterium]|nr:glycosyltransferase family 4 protein [Thermodesulfovibrionales bacterium]